jgi:transposase
MQKYIRIGIDIAKNSFQVHALESEDCSATKRKLSRSGIVKFLAEVEPCAIGMEACGSAHYWARRFRAMWPRGKTHAADLRETLCQARQERHGGCGGDLRGDVSAEHAFRRRQERGPRPDPKPGNAIER